MYFYLQERIKHFIDNVTQTPIAIATLNCIYFTVMVSFFILGKTFYDAYIIKHSRSAVNIVVISYSDGRPPTISDNENIYVGKTESFIYLYSRTLKSPTAISMDGVQSVQLIPKEHTHTVSRAPKQE